MPLSRLCTASWLHLKSLKGDAVQAGQRLAILEAMKMQHEIVAPDAGTVDTIVSAAGKQVAQGDMLLTLTLASEAES